MPPSKIQQTLARNRLGVPAILAIIIAAAAPMSVIFGGAAAAFATSELVALPLACIAIAVLLACWAPGYLAMGRDIANAGSTYSYISRGLGRVPGAAGGGIALVGYNMMQCAFYGGFGLAASQLTSAVGVATPWWAWAVPAWLVVGLLGLGKVDISSRVLMVLLAGEVGIVAIFTLVFLAEPGPAGVDATALDPAQLGQASTLVALGLAFAGFVGLESCSAFSEEARNYGALSRAIVAAVVTVGVLYGIGTWALTVATGPGGIVAAANAEGTDLAFSLASQRVAAGWVLLARLLYATSMFAGLLAWHNVANRYFFALGREGVLPGRLARTSRAGAPRAASLTQSTLAGLVLVVFLLLSADPMTHLWYWGSTTGALGILTLLIGTAASVLAYFLRQPADRRPRVGTLVASALAVLGLGTVLVATLVQFHLLTGTTSHATWILPSVLGVAALAAAGWALVLRARRPWVWRRLGYGTSAALVDEDGQDPEHAPAQNRNTSPAATHAASQLTGQPLAAALPPETIHELQQAVSTLRSRGVERHAALDAIVRKGLAHPDAILAEAQQQDTRQTTTSRRGQHAR